MVNSEMDSEGIAIREHEPLTANEGVVKTPKNHWRNRILVPKKHRQVAWGTINGPIEDEPSFGRAGISSSLSGTSSSL